VFSFNLCADIRNFARSSLPGNISSVSNRLIGVDISDISEDAAFAWFVNVSGYNSKGYLLSKDERILGSKTHEHIALLEQ
jgi:hypothetical protein